MWGVKAGILEITSEDPSTLVLTYEWPPAMLKEQKNAFAATFWEKHDEKPLRDIVNVNETAVYYDMPPRRTWCEIGEDAKVDSTEKHSDRLTAVLGA
ncbi:hypothetical protein DYB26_007358 [Aphanomyces astaci]|uniref:Uncharacterized protein n=1 Tax=Aphanomyces astaci TaxID=112090 RepID=A0A418EYL6_APHAT|nr:hypothetical protein DYB26_007358 [Aphanomyces astaci]